MNPREVTFYINNLKLTVTSTAWEAVAAEALVLPANNRLTLRETVGLTRWLDERCPWLHDECQQAREEREPVPGRGLLPGDGIITPGALDGKTIIHAVVLDYDRPHGTGLPYAGLDTISAAAVFAIDAALMSGIRSLAFPPMGIHGQADKSLPRSMAAEVGPQVQAQTIFGKVLVSPQNNLQQVYFCTRDPAGNGRSDHHFQVIADSWNDLYKRFYSQE